MHRSLTLFAAVTAALLILAAPTRVAAHGEVDEEMLAEFQDHLDDFHDDVKSLIAEVDPIVAAYADGDDVSGRIESLIEQWEEVGIHAVIETRATVTYPGVWQALVSLQQAVSAGKPPARVAEAGNDVEAALWQGLGAVRLPASQVGSAPASPDTDAAPASGPATVQQILDDLDQAVAAYRSGHLSQAEQLIHQTYMTRFEGLEGDLIEHDPDLVSSLEKDFNATLPLLMQEGADIQRVQERLEAMKTRLRSASDILEMAEQSRSEVF